MADYGPELSQLLVVLRRDVEITLDPVKRETKLEDS
jgi:hypothetical protein